MKKTFYVLIVVLIASCRTDDDVLIDEPLCGEALVTDCDKSRKMPTPDNYQLDTIAYILANSSYEYPSQIDQIQFVNESLGFAKTRYFGGDRNELFKTTDGGVSWELISTEMATDWYVDMHFEDENSGVIVLGDTNELLVTENGGIDWEVRSLNGVEGSPFAVSFDESGKLYISSTISNSRCNIYRSSDNGISWEELYTHNSQMEEMEVTAGSIYLYSALELLNISLNGDLLTVVEPVRNVIRDLDILNENEWVYQDYPLGLYATKDAGENWEEISDSITEIIGFDSADKGLFIDVIGFCPEGDNDEDSENCAIVSYDSSNEVCKFSAPAYYLRSQISTSQKVAIGEWFIVAGGYLVKITEI
ncbi:MAG: YCF48-related protein [Bacteroidota bacterium]